MFGIGKTSLYKQLSEMISLLLLLACILKGKSGFAKPCEHLLTAAVEVLDCDMHSRSQPAPVNFPKASLAQY